MPASTPRDAAPPPGSETLEVGGWQVVVTDEHAVLPEGMPHLPGDAFRLRTSLVSVACPRSLVSIGNGAFSQCSSLVSIDLPATLTSIGDHAFFRCITLVSVAFPSSLATIGTHAFSPCYSLVSIDLPAGLTSIGNKAFARCSSLASVALPLPDGLSICDCAFSDCRLNDEAEASAGHQRLGGAASNPQSTRRGMPLCRRASPPYPAAPS